MVRGEYGSAILSYSIPLASRRASFRVIADARFRMFAQPNPVGERLRDDFPFSSISWNRSSTSLEVA
jgi:hypothetical protein